ncbi:hypothetical protein AcV5_008648 [Taiwanofungus camphoratus]|nr:hypothetical protein AcV5_008648 [Antrodia cinnamomea]KAI0956173.1 hypothetical protein AcV7_006640 [Antrodia cinnamomea]
MATTARQPKPQRKGMPEPAARRGPAWTGPRASPTFSPGAASARLPNGAQPGSPGAFPPLGHTNGTQGGPRADKDAPHERVLAQLSGLTGTTITLSTKTNVRYEGTVASTSGEGDTTGVTLRDVKELSSPGAPLKDQLFIAATNIDQWTSGPADARTPAQNGDSFKTDTDISKTGLARRERELQAWQPDEVVVASSTSNASAPTSPRPSAPSTLNGAGGRDELTFGPGAGTGGAAWDQFAVNERLFGVRAGFDEEAYTTRLDRNAPDYKERERRAAAIANEIMQSTTNNPHIAEERTQNPVGDGSTNEEDKYGAVVRSVNAYVPPGARKPGINPTTVLNPKSDVPKVAVNAPDGSIVGKTQTATGTPPPKTPSPAPAAGGKPAVDAVPAFRDFVSNEKDRLLKKKQALMKNEMDKRMAELVKFSQNFKLNKPIPDDLVPILAKDEDKQRQIREKSTRDAESTHARAIGTTVTLTASPTVVRVAPTSQNPPSSAKPPIHKSTSPAAGASGTQKPAGTQAKAGEPAKRISMIIQPIPPFKGKRTSTPASVSASGASTTTSSGARSQPPASNSPLSPAAAAAANRLNANANSFRPNVKPFSPPGGSPNPNGTSSSSASPKTKPADGSTSPQAQGPPNPFFGTRVLKKGPPVYIKEDFNPFKYHKVVEAAQVAPMWPYQGKRYMQMFPPLQVQPQQQSPHMAPPPPPPMPPPSYEEDSAAQAAARGYVYAPYPYGYPGQPMMPGMGPPPPGAYIPGPPFMQHMPYPHMPPNAMYPTTPMGQMPPPQAYMPPPPPPGAYPPPNGAAPRPSMPPTPIPSHAHPYYHQSPQRQFHYYLWLSGSHPS